MHLRHLIALAASLLFALLLLALLYATDLFFEVLAHLRSAPWWFAALYAIAIGGLAAAGGWFIWRLATRRRRPLPQRPTAPPDEPQLLHRLRTAQAQGVDVSRSLDELRELRARRATGTIDVVLFGRVSTGKSALIQALLPDARIAIDPRAGTTRSVDRYTWESPAGDTLVITDVPGLEEPGRALDGLALEEARRAHVVVYVADADLTRQEHIALQQLVALGKPLVVAINKQDLYAADELAQLRARIGSYVPAGQAVEIVAVNTGTERETERILPDGSREWVTRRLAPQLGELKRAMQTSIDRDRAALEKLRDAAVFVLATDQLDQAVARHRSAEADRLVGEFTRKAMVAALAAISPGMDVLLQGYLGYQLLRRLGELYEHRLSQHEIEDLLRQAGGRIGRLLPMTLAIAGNVLKAFPGLGTVTGGLVHAVAYGLIFDALGRAAARTLAERGSLPPPVVLQNLEETLLEDLDARVPQLAQLALGQLRDSATRGTGDRSRR